MVVVFGSLNVDLVARVSRFPRPGETLAGDSFATYPGGKGGNQALAAARAGAAVAMVGAVGGDAFAVQALAGLVAGGVDVAAIRAVDGPTGVAVIEVAASGENTILVIAGANARVDACAVPREWLRPSTVVALQQEVPAAANLALAQRARAAGARVVLNAAPARDIDPALLALTDVLVVNETEMRALAVTAEAAAEPPALAAALAAQHGIAIVITLGAAGAVAAERGSCYTLSAPPVAVVDATGAGDAFVGALAAALERGLPLRAALSWAVAAGSLACTGHGAQPSLPYAARIAPVASALDSQVIVLT
jgi:ribokinase